MNLLRRIAVLMLIPAMLVGNPALAASDPAYRAYAHDVRLLTEKVYRRNQDTIDPLHRRGKEQGFDLDHVVAIKQCWLQHWSVKACAAPSNLRVIRAHDNRSAGCKAKGCRLRRR